MTDFEKMVTKLRESPYTEGRHFEVYEYESGVKEIGFIPSTLCEDWTYFEYDNNGNLIRIF